MELMIRDDQNDALAESGLGLVNTGNQYLSFTLHNEHYAVDILGVQEIRGWEEPTLIPNSPPFVKGVINIRGLVIPVIDLRERFDICEPTYSKTNVVIVIRRETETGPVVIGFVVDTVSDVFNIGAEDITEKPDFGEKLDPVFITGLAEVMDHTVTILNIETLVDIEMLEKDFIKG